MGIENFVDSSYFGSTYSLNVNVTTTTCVEIWYSILNAVTRDIL